MADTVLVVEDEEDVLELVVHHLRRAGYQTDRATDGTTGLLKARSGLPSLVLLDLMLPGLEGTAVCRQLKDDPRTAHIPLVMLTARADEVDRILGLELGADDYITKPFAPRELVLRVKKLLNRAPGAAGPRETLVRREVVVDVASHTATAAGRKLDLTVTEFKLLATLLERGSRVQSRDMLLRDVWGYEGDVDTRTVDTHMRRLRAKLGAAAALIETVRGVGYRCAMA